MYYRVTWEIDIEAGSPQQAAKQALAIQRDPQSTATMFKIRMVSPCPICKQTFVHKSTCKLRVELKDEHFSEYVDRVYEIDAEVQS